MYLSQSLVITSRTFQFFIYFALFIFRQIGSWLILAMWTRAICNSLEFTFPQIFLTVNQAWKNVCQNKIKRRTPINMTRQIQMKTTHESHTPPLGYASLLPCLERWSSSRGCLSKSSWSENLAWGSLLRCLPIALVITMSRTSKWPEHLRRWCYLPLNGGMALL